MKKDFFRYVSRNAAGMVGVALYILADTYFISRAVGADGITALNLVLPLYNVIFAIGEMLGVGGAIRYALCKERGDERADRYYFQAAVLAVLIGLLFTAVGLFGAESLVRMLGGDQRITAVAAGYTRIFMIYSPFFMLNYVGNAFVRNDNRPDLAMAATLFSSLFNIVMDYVLMFPCKLGMNGAALATGMSPIVGILICASHLFSRKSSVKLVPGRISGKMLGEICRFGASAGIAELSCGIVTAAYNFIMLGLLGNVLVAAYGVVANLALVVMAVFKGISQGSQPLVCAAYAKGRRQEQTVLIRLSLVTAFACAALLTGVIWLFSGNIAAVFNGEHNAVLQEHAVKGLRLYSLGFLLAGMNVVGITLLCSMERVRQAFAASIMRGFFLILAALFIFAKCFGVTGVWLAFPVTESVTFLFTYVCLRTYRRNALPGQ